LIALWELFRMSRAGFPLIVEAFVVVLGLAGLWWLRVLENVVGKPEGLWVPLVLIPVLPTWTADIVAYLVGSTVGSRKIAPRLSPGKTWEGTIAGFIAAGLIAYGIARVDYAWYAPIFALLVGPGAHRNADDLRTLATEFPAARTALGPNALVALATDADADLVLVATPGVAALRATVAALDDGKCVALANKEVLVAAGHLIRRLC